MSESRAQRHVAPRGRPRAGPPSETAPGVRRDGSFIEFAHAVLRREAAALAAAKPRLPEAPSPDEIHQLRVAARRLRVALRLFGRMLPTASAGRYRTELKWLASSLGDVRDLDVYTENFKSYVQSLPPAQRGSLGGYQLYLRRERAEARRKAAAALASARAAALFTELEHFAGAGPSAGAVRRWGSLTVRDAVAQSVRRSVRRVRALGNGLMQRARPAELHDLRIKIKRLRYELEFFAAVYPPLAETAKDCKALQDLLGNHQDVDAANARLRRYAEQLRKRGEDSGLPEPLVQLRKNQLAIAREARRAFREQWSGFVTTIGAARKLVA